MLPIDVKKYQMELNQCFRELDMENLWRITAAVALGYGKIFIIGNGGSAANASHMAVDLSKINVPNYHRVKAISLTDNTSLITAVANDISYEEVFTEQLKNHMTFGDMLIAMSVSGNSPNIISAVTYAKNRGALTVGFIGFGGGKLREKVDIDITVSSKNYGVVEDFHLSLNHMISQHIAQERNAWHSQRIS